MDNKWHKDYSQGFNLFDAGRDDNTSITKLSHLIGHHKRVIDLGCATGLLAKLLVDKGCAVTGVEINPEAAKVAAQYCDRVIVADLDFVSLKELLAEETFDVAVFGDVLEHLRDPWGMLEAVKALLKPEGCVVASIPNVAHAAVRLALLQGKFEYEPFGILDDTHLRFFTRDTVQRLFEKTGYFIDVQDQTVVPLFSGSDLIPRFDQQTLSPELIAQVTQDSDAETLQFIVRAFPVSLEGQYASLSDRYERLLRQHKQLQAQQESHCHQQAELQDNLQQAQTLIQQLQEERGCYDALEQTLQQLPEIKARFQWSQAQLKEAQAVLGDLEAKVRNFQGRFRKAEANLEKTREELETTRNQLTAIQTSKFWKLRTAWFKFKDRLGLVSAGEMFTPGRKVKASPSDDLIPAKTNPAKAIAKMFAFISDCPGDAYRYRCQHQAEMLEILGYTVDVYKATELPYEKLLQQYCIVVAHRVPHTYEFEQFVKQAANAGVKVVYDTDDLVFDPTNLCQIDAYMKKDEKDQQIYADGVRRYRHSLSLCDYAIVSTEKLQREVNRNFAGIQTAISRNRISREMEQAAIQAQQSYLPPDDGVVRIAYFSGTRTHEKDFAECVEALRDILQALPQAHLMVVGHLEIPEILQEFTPQIEQVPLVPWQSLPLLYRKVNINLAPLEANNDFTEAKSELKYFEAGLLAVPTIASNREAFRIAVQDGVNGRLCRDAQEWRQALQELVTQPEQRRQLGQAAYEDVQTRYLTRTAARETLAVWQQLIGGKLAVSPLLSIALTVRAPIAGTGGGYNKLFQLAHYLADRGHQVHVYVEPINHLAEASEERIRQFCQENFGRSAAQIHRGFEQILPSDVAIATNWPTAYVVNDLKNTRFKAYFIQDYEPDFYQPSDPYFSQAQATYDLPLGMISIGSYLAELLSKRNRISYPHIDFSLGEAFLQADPKLDRHDASDRPCSILFFACPHLPRRNFGVGIKALEMLHQQAPEVKILLYGMEEERSLPFPYENLGVLSQADTAAAMRSAHMHLSFSMTNISTVIFEAMACGCATVEADVASVRSMVNSGETCLLTPPHPQAVAEALLKLVQQPVLRQQLAIAGYQSVKQLTVENMCAQFEQLLQQYCFR
jgi:glycosyltransferase involved in cell wall biosynthesis/2-polyprenyl-3-methyl-5-hydroxy-6-metoxy-1,4-benzoquinol methylase